MFISISVILINIWAITMIALLHIMTDKLSVNHSIADHPAGPGRRTSYRLLFTPTATGTAPMSPPSGPLPRPLRRPAPSQHRLRTSSRPRPPCWTVSTSVSRWRRMHFALISRVVSHLLNRRHRSQEFSSGPAERHRPGCHSQVSCLLPLASLDF